MLWAVSRAPLEKLQGYKRRMGWTFPWASSVGGDFNFDFSASFTEQQQREGIEYNYRREAAWQQRNNEGIATRMTGDPVGDNAAMTGTDVATYTRERPGMSAFALEDGVVYYTYSTYARGLDGLWGMYQWLDRAPKGRNESETGPLVAPPRRVRQTLSQVVGRWRNCGGYFTTHGFRASFAASLLRVSALLFAASAAVTIVSRRCAFTALRTA